MKARTTLLAALAALGLAAAVPTQAEAGGYYRDGHGGGYGYGEGRSYGHDGWRQGYGRPQHHHWRPQYGYYAPPPPPVYYRPQPYAYAPPSLFFGFRVP